VIERKQFQPLPESGPEEQWIEQCLKDIEKLGSLGNLAAFERAIKAGERKKKQEEIIYKDGANVKLNLVEFASLIKPEPQSNPPFPKLTQGVIEVYEECIVRYKNKDFQDN
jgi:hypothetical protein